MRGKKSEYRTQGMRENNKKERTWKIVCDARENYKKSCQDMTIITSYYRQTDDY